MIYLFQTKGSQTRLTPNKLNEELRFIEAQKDQVWDKKVFIDLSKIEWINTSALVELILVIENLIEKDVKVTVALPNINMLSSEARHLKEQPIIRQHIESDINKRKRAREWLYRLRIIKALSFEHQTTKIRSNIKVLDRFDRELFEQNPIEEESNYYKIHGPFDADQEKIGEKDHVPLLWTEGYDYQSDHIKKILAKRLDISHAQIISDIVIKELAKNVEDHSSKKHGLFCAVVSRCNPEVAATDYYKDDMPFLENSKQKDENTGEKIIEIVFGDSGCGIIKKLQKYSGRRSGVELLQYSFDKWSTSDPYDDDYKSYIKRGTRGLYHVRRVVQSYEGMVAIRTKNFYAGFNDLTNDPIGETTLNEFNGTLLTIRLLPERGKTLKGKYYPSELDSEKALACEHVSIDISDISESIKRIGTQSQKDSYKNFLISLDFSKCQDGKYSDESGLDSQLRELLSELSNLRHPNVHIVYGFPPNFESTRIEKIVNGVNEAVKRKHDKDADKVFDPIMIIGPKGSIHWAGVKDPKLVIFLNELMKTEDLSLPIDYINRAENRELIEYIKQDTELFCIHNKSIKLNFNQNAPIEYFKKEIETKIIELAKEGNQRTLITPHLKCVKGWFDVKAIYTKLRNEYALSLYSLWHNNRFVILRTLFQKDRSLKKEKEQDYSNEELDKIQCDLFKGNLKILVGSEIDIPSGEMFLHLLNIREQSNLKILSDEVDSKKPRRNRLFDEDDYVIIITSVVSTSETAKSLIKSVLRSNATPVCLLSLADFSGIEFGEEQKTIRQWGNPVLFYSIITRKDLIASTPVKVINYQSIIGNKNEKIPQKDSFYVEDELREMILNSKSLHFSHIGKSNGRHFTFYFNAKRFLNEINEEHRVKIWEKLKDAVNKFYRSRDINLDSLDKNKRRTVGDQTFIWYPDREYKKGYQGQGVDLSAIIKNGLKKDYKIDKIVVDSVSRDGTQIINDNHKQKDRIYSIIVDWGSITGESIEKLIYKAHKNRFENIFVCIFLNQLSDNKKAYLTSISTITSDLPFSSDNEITHQPMALTDTIESTHHNQRAMRPKQLELFDQKILSEKRSNKENIKTEPFTSNVRIEFINDFPLTCYESDYECNVCALREDLEKYEIQNAILEDYTKKRRRVLDIRPRELTMQEPFDFYSEDQNEISLDQEFILRMFEFKTLLMNAQSSTYWRFRVKVEFIKILKTIINTRAISLLDVENEILRKCNDITNDFEFMFPKICISEEFLDYNVDVFDSRTHAMIYFLSVETSWIQKPPLSNDELRKMLSLISQTIIFNRNLKLSRDGNKDKKAIRIKYAAITVLRMADKKDFIRNIFDILKNTHVDDTGSNSIIENMLFHTNTFISKDYHSNHSELDEVKNELDRVEDLFNKEKNHSSSLIRDANISLQLKIDNLIIRGQVRKLKLVELVKNCLSDIEKGIEKIKYDHSALIQNFRDLELRSVEIDEGDRDYFIKSFNRNWLYVSGFIKNIIGIYLNEIIEILDPDWGFSKGFKILKPYLFTKNFGIDDSFSFLIRQIKDSNQNLTDKSFIKNYNEEYENIRDIFISHPKYNGKDSLVFNILASLHGDLNMSLEYAIAKYCPNHILFSTIDDMRHNVFYPQDLLDELIEHLFRNGVEKKIEKTLPEIIFKSTWTDDGYIILNITYKNTHPYIHKGSGTGLSTHKEFIRKFDGTMKYDPEEKKNFTVEIKLVRY